MKSIEGNFDNPKVNELLINHFIELSSVSPVDRGHVLDISGLKNLRIKFWSLWENDELIGCGALKFLDKEHSELKSIRVADFFRPARKLFHKCGFKPCEPFAHYKKDLDACYMSLLISN